ncbi:MAG TPA: TIGR04255 family protein [Methanofastidiosum sp.]|nr:MAG: hypothetical protein BWX72_00162 [Firmicutes bacterium ADurb.Bin080]HOE92558.1 TIGR04255 family protein [Methanofastidiosum sp.]HOR88833.1 TIGR04255 family protein [Methanofastidiosum sp.]HPL01319.1 TIGR04255 family protein [Methanofastidiosum sp.]
MVINEIFPNPTVKQVIFQIKFPNLLYIENRLGDFQLEIIDEFPKSSVIYKRQVLFADTGPGGKLEGIPVENEEPGFKIWEFKSDKNIKIMLSTYSLSIVSEYHKTYSLDGGEKFRDIIISVLESFFKIMKIPHISRIGLRYIDECPLPSKNNDTLNEYYNSAFPTGKFKLENTEEMQFVALIEREGHKLRYSEVLKKVNSEYQYILDFDGFTHDIETSKYLEVTDKLHTLISDEFEKTIKKPVYDHMRGT